MRQMPFTLVAALVLSLIGIESARAQNVPAFGRLVYPDRRPAAGVRVEVRNRTNAIALTTDARGIFRLQLERRDLGTHGGGPTRCAAPKLWVLLLFNSSGLNKPAQDYLRGFGNGCWG